MKFADFVSSRAIRAELEAYDKEGTVREMATATAVIEIYERVEKIEGSYAL